MKKKNVDHMQRAQQSSAIHFKADLQFYAKKARKQGINDKMQECNFVECIHLPMNSRQDKWADSTTDTGMEEESHQSLKDIREG